MRNHWVCVHRVSFCFPPTCPVIWGRRNGHRWFFAIIFCLPPSFFPVPSFPELHSIHPPCPRSFSFPGGFMSIICLQVCSSGRLLTCPNPLQTSFCHCIFATPTAPRMYSVLILSFRVTPHIHLDILISCSLIVKYT